MRRRINEKTLGWLGVALFLPVMILLFTISRAPYSFMSSVYIQGDDIDMLRGRIASGRIYYPSVVSDILTRRLYPSFILCLLIGGNPGKFILRMFFYLRFGMMSLLMFRFLSAHVKISNVWSLILGSVYSLSPVTLLAASNPQVLNVMIVMPLVMCTMDRAMRGWRTRRNVFIAALSASFLATGGVLGVITGIVFVSALIWMLKGLVPGARVGAAVKAFLLSLTMQLPLMIPVFLSGMSLVDVKAEYAGSKITFKYFDLLCQTLDGNPVYVPIPGNCAVMGMSVLVLVLVLLFFINGTIPFRAKLPGIILTVVLPVSASWSLVNSLLSVYDFAETAGFMRMTVLVALMFLMAGVSLRNAKALSSNNIFGAVICILSLIVISNSSSATEVTRSTYYLWFNAGAALFWGIAVWLISQGETKIKVTYLFAVLGATGIVINLAHTFAISSFLGVLSTPGPYSSPASEVNVNINGGWPLYSRDSEYIVVSSDLRQLIDDKSFPELINNLSGAQDDILVPADAFTVFSEGVSTMGFGRYKPVNPGSSSEILIRCENMDPSAQYCIFSSFAGRYTLTEDYEGNDLTDTLQGPYFKSLGRSTDSVSLRQVGATPDLESELSLWRVNGEALSALQRAVKPMKNYSSVVEDDPASSYAGYVTIVTSVPYEKNYSIRVTAPGGSVSSESFSYGGRLAAVYYSDGMFDYSFLVRSSGAVPGVAIVLWIVTSSIVVYNCFSKKKEDELKADA